MARRHSRVYVSAERQVRPDDRCFPANGLRPGSVRALHCAVHMHTVRTWNQCVGRSPTGAASPFSPLIADRELHTPSYSPSLLSPFVEVPCSIATPGKYSDAMGRTSSPDCPAGKYSSHSHQANCKSCMSGRYAPASGSTMCTDAEAGKYVRHPGANSSVACPPGTHTENQTRQSGCALCPLGRHLQS